MNKMDKEARRKEELGIQTRTKDCVVCLGMSVVRTSKSSVGGVHYE